MIQMKQNKKAQAALNKAKQYPLFDLARRLFKKHGFKHKTPGKIKPWENPPIENALNQAIYARLVEDTKLTVPKLFEMTED